MPDTELAKRLRKLAGEIRDRIKRRNKGNFSVTVDETLVEQFNDAQLALDEAAAALSAAREREARHAAHMTEKADQLWQQARAEAMEDVEREARTWPIIGGLVANRIRALAAGQGGENG